MVSDADEDAVLVAAGLYLTGGDTLDWLRDYALTGGHLDARAR